MSSRSVIEKCSEPESSRSEVSAESKDPFLHRTATTSGSGSDCTRRLAQKLLDVYIAARRNSTLGEIAASPAASSDRRQHLPQQRAHVGSRAGRAASCLRENHALRI